jgi:hypothetical protein
MRVVRVCTHFIRRVGVAQSMSEFSSVWSHAHHTAETRACRRGGRALLRGVARLAKKGNVGRRPEKRKLDRCRQAQQTPQRLQIPAPTTTTTSGDQHRRGGTWSRRPCPSGTPAARWRGRTQPRWKWALCAVVGRGLVHVRLGRTSICSTWAWRPSQGAMSQESWRCAVVGPGLVHLRFCNCSACVGMVFQSRHENRRHAEVGRGLVHARASCALDCTRTPAAASCVSTAVK